MNEDSSGSYPYGDASPYSEPSYTEPAGDPAFESGYEPPRAAAGPSYAPPEYPADSPRPKKQRRGMSAGAVVALCLVCALIAGLAGAGGTYLALRRGGGNALGEALDAIVPTPMPVISTTSGGKTVSGAAAAIYELAKQQVVGVTTDITVYNIFGQASAASVTGSGVVITEDGYILTNFHVIEDAYKGGYQVEVMMYDGTSYAAEIVGFDKDNDLALLKIDAAGLNAAQLGDSDDLVVGQTVYAVGNPLGELSYTMTGGMVSATDRTITTESDVAVNMFQIDAAVNSGNSGGPVYNAEGQVVGIVTAKYASSGVEGLGFAIPINDAAHISNQILEYGYVADKAYMGVTTVTVTPSIASAYGMVEGAYVNELTPGGPAETAGLQTGDTITAMDGQTVGGSSELTSMLRSYHAGDTAVLTVSRQGQELELTVTFDAKPRQEETVAERPDGRKDQYDQYYSGDIEDFFRQFFGGFGPFGY